MIVTRFRPTPNGLLHLGGAYTAWQNWKAAQAGGGEFILIWDDVQHLRKDPLVSRPVMRRMAEAQRRDLEWFDCPPDRCAWASEFSEAHRTCLGRLGIPEESPDFGQNLRYVHSLAQSGAVAQYSAWLVAGRVSDDHELGVTAFVRGGDLYSEAVLYDYFAVLLYGDSYRILQDYLAQLYTPSTNSKISKTRGGWTLAECREAGYTPEEIKRVLANLSPVKANIGIGALRYVAVPVSMLQIPKES